MEAGRTLDAPAEFFGAKLATRNLHPIAELSAENCTEQMGVPGPWYERLPHFRMGFTPSAGKELQSEYFVPRQHAVEAILAVERLRDQISPHLLISEIRTIAADDLWMSPCYHQASVDHSLHLEAGLAGGQQAPAGDRKGAGAIPTSSALGQAVYGSFRTAALELREAARVRQIGEEIRSAGKIPK